MTKISVIMPSLNVVEYIDECIQSVINQTLKEIEIICVDAGSTDGTYEKLLKYAELDSRIRIIVSDVKSYGKQINTGIQQAKGKYIGIVETDDFIDSNMYEQLYELSEKYGLEFIKGDYDAVYRNSDNTYTTIPTRMFDKNLAFFYNQLLSPANLPILHELGLNIWRGIYRKDFLVNSNIYLNETKGAAFQDTAFYHQLIMKSHRAMFVKESYYKYRQDREESSFKNPNTLIYTYDEYRELIDQYRHDQNVSPLHWHYIYVKMLREYVKHMKNYIITHNYNENSLNEILDKIEWFNYEINNAIENGILCQTDFSTEIWEDYSTIRQSARLFAELVKVRMNEDNIIIKNFWKDIENSNIIVFGIGAYGKKVSGILNLHGYSISAYCDNNETVHEFIGKKVYQPEQAITLFEDAVYIVASKWYADDMKRQLEALGVCYDKIKKYSTIIM